MRTSAVAFLAATAMALGACGGDDDDEASAPTTTKKEAAADVGPLPSDPEQIKCGHLSDPGSRQASNALAAEANITSVSQLQAAQSIYFAMTEICKKEQPDFTPAKEAVAAVKSGKYTADLGTP